jgi:hypothetical protein
MVKIFPLLSYVLNDSSEQLCEGRARIFRFILLKNDQNYCLKHTIQDRLGVTLA